MQVFALPPVLKELFVVVLCCADELVYDVASAIEVPCTAV
jgi:hypothetical protein